MGGTKWRFALNFQAAGLHSHKLTKLKEGARTDLEKQCWSTTKKWQIPADSKSRSMVQHGCWTAIHMNENMARKITGELEAWSDRFLAIIAPIADSPTSSSSPAGL